MNISNFIVVYDACVLFSGSMRDLLVRIATKELFRAKWTTQIHDEWSRNLMSQAKISVTREKVDRVIQLMNSAVPDCLVEGYQDLIRGLSLPDPNDNHVLAAAIRAGASVIVTNNLRDFPSAILDQYGIEAQSPDDFIEGLFDLSEHLVIEAVREQRKSLQNPSKSPEEFLATLGKNGLIKTVKKIRSSISKI